MWLCIPVTESTLLSGPVMLLCLGEKLGRLGLRDIGLGVVGSHLGEVGDCGISRHGGGGIRFPCFFPRFLIISSASENSLSDVGSHFTDFELVNLLEPLVFDGTFFDCCCFCGCQDVFGFVKPFSRRSVNS